MDAETLEKLNSLLDKDVDIREVTLEIRVFLRARLTGHQKIRDQVTELDKKTRTVVGLLNKIHSTPVERCSFSLVAQYQYPPSYPSSYFSSTGLTRFHQTGSE